MALTMGPNTGLLENGDPGEGHYVELMRKWRWGDFLMQPVVKSRLATLPTAGQVNGDAYLFIGTGTNANRIARWTTRLATAQWEYLIPKAGWRIQVNDELDVNNQRVTYEFSGSVWVEKLASGGWDLRRITPISSGVLTLDLSSPAGFVVTLDQNVTSLVFSGAPSDRFVTFAVVFIQDSTGGRTITWPSSVQGSPVQPSATAETATIMSFITYDGGATVWQVV